MAKLTDLTIKNMDKYVSEPVNARGDGTLYFEKRAGLIEGYFRYSFNSKRQKIKIDNYKTNKTGLTLKELRERSRELSALQKKHPDLKSYLERIERDRVARELEKSRTGSFKDLLDSYTESLTNPATKKTVENLFKKDVFDAFPGFKDQKASDISVDDIVQVLKKVFERGVTTNGNRLRSYLLSAFNQAVLAANDPLKQDKKYDIKINPVTNIPTQRKFEHVNERVLTHDEVKHLWNHIHDVDGISDNTAYLIQFLLAIGGQRPQQVVRSGWDKFDYRLRTILINDTKGRGGARDYLTPLTQRALDILDELVTQDLTYPFTSTGKVPVRVETLHKWIEKYCKEFEVEKFTPRDIRRTCKNLMIDAGVSREARNLIQNHGLTGIDFKHYDKRDHLPEKLEGMRKYDNLLEKIITGKMAKVVYI